MVDQSTTVSAGEAGRALITRQRDAHHEARQTSQVASRWRRSAIVLACVAPLLAGCGDAAGQGESAGAPPSRQEDAATLVQRALAARAANDPAEFAALVSAASRSCPAPGAARRLGEVAGIAARWSSALLEGRPKAQAVTEAQLSRVDWEALAAACEGE